MDPISVKRGDNLTKIAKMYDTTVDELIKLNPQLKDRPNTIFVGEKINLPKPPSEKPYPGLGVERQDDGIPKAPWQDDKKPVENKAPKTPTQEKAQSTLDSKSVLIGVAAGGAGGITGYALGEKYAPQIADATRNAIKKAKVKMNDAKAAIDKAKASGKEKMAKLKAGTKRAFRMSDGTKQNIQHMKTVMKNVTKETLEQGKKIPHHIKTSLDPNIHGAAKKSARAALKKKALSNPRHVARVYGRVLKTTSKIASKVPAARFLGKAAVPVAAAFECYNIGKAYKEGGTKKAVKQAGVSGASLGGAWAGAKAGAAIGVFGGPVGAVVGGVVGGVIGYAAGNWLGRKVIG